MTFRYYWDRELFDALLRYRMRPYLLDVLKAGNPMASTADLAKLVKNMERSNSLISTAAKDAETGTAIMDRFEARLSRNRDHMSKIDEYEKQLAAMDSLGDNGGPALDATFSVAQPGPAPTQPDAVTTASTVQPAIHHDTGDPIR